MKNRISLCLCVSVAKVVILLLLLRPGWAQTAEELLQQADEALLKSEFAVAALKLEAYLAQHPQDFRAKFNLAFAYSLTGRKAEAIRYYQEVLAQQEDLIPAHFNLGILLLEQGNAAEAADHLRRVLDKQPDHLAAIVNLGEALAVLKRVPEAREAYERALLLQPEDAATHLALGELLAESDSVAAEKHARRALQLNPSLDDARLLLAAALESRAAQGANTLPEAAELYRQYLETHPQRADLRLRLGDIYLSQKRFPDAIRELEAARSTGSATSHPNQALELNQALLQAYLEVKDKEKALALLPELLAQDERNAEWPLLLGSLQMEKKQYPAAARAFLRATQLDPQSDEGYRNLASALYLLKDYEGTVAALDKVAALGKDTAGSYFLRAITLDALGRQQPALENYRRFLQWDEGKSPDQEFQARQRIQILTRELRRRGGRAR